MSMCKNRSLSCLQHLVTINYIHSLIEKWFIFVYRGVFQTVVEKHFPAPDRRKFFDIFGLGGNSSSYNEDSNPPTPGNNKRKKGM